MPLPEVDFGPEIEDYAAPTSPNSCDPSPKPGVSIVADFLLTTAGGCCWAPGLQEPSGIVRACSIGAASDHHEGRAFDWMLHASDPEQRKIAEDFLTWLLKTDRYGNEHANLRRMGITYLIWNRQAFSSYRPYWRAYTRENPHTDHIHISFGWPGARGETSFQRWLSGELPAEAIWRSPTARLLAGAALALGAWLGYQYVYQQARV